MVAPIGYHSEIKLTGKQRVRRGWFGKLILQVQVELIYMHPLNRPRICTPTGNPVSTAWRDATEADVEIKYGKVNVNA
jgi:hypothetical protein